MKEEYKPTLERAKCMYTYIKHIQISFTLAVSLMNECHIQSNFTHF